MTRHPPPQVSGAPHETSDAPYGAAQIGHVIEDGDREGRLDIAIFCLDRQDRRREYARYHRQEPVAWYGSAFPRHRHLTLEAQHEAADAHGPEDAWVHDRRPRSPIRGVRQARISRSQLATAPARTIGPVGLFDPPAGSIETAKAVTSAGRALAACPRLAPRLRQNARTQLRSRRRGVCFGQSLERGIVERALVDADVAVVRHAGGGPTTTFRPAR